MALICGRINKLRSLLEELIKHDEIAKNLNSTGYNNDDNKYNKS
jgi:hypothetical protein